MSKDAFAIRVVNEKEALAVHDWVDRVYGGFHGHGDDCRNGLWECDYEVDFVIEGGYVHGWTASNNMKILTYAQWHYKYLSVTKSKLTKLIKGEKQ